MPRVLLRRPGLRSRLSQRTGRRAVGDRSFEFVYAVLRPLLRLLPVSVALRAGPARSRLAASWPLSPSCGGARTAGRFPSILPKQDAHVAYQYRPAFRADPRCGNLSPHDRHRPFLSCRCARRLPIKGQSRCLPRRGRGGWKLAGVPGMRRGWGRVSTRGAGVDVLLLAYFSSPRSEG